MTIQEAIVTALDARASELNFDANAEIEWLDDHVAHVIEEWAHANGYDHDGELWVKVPTLTQHVAESLNNSVENDATINDNLKYADLRASHADIDDVVKGLAGDLAACDSFVEEGLLRLKFDEDALCGAVIDWLKSRP